MEEYVELQEVDGFLPEEHSTAVYPHILLDGVTTEEEVLYFHNRFQKSEASLPLYIKFESLYRCIGSFELTLDNLLVVKNIADYKLTLVLSESKQTPINLETPEDYLTFLNIF